MSLGNKSIFFSSRATLVGVSLVASSVSGLAAEYKMTVSKDRLINSANEPQNWLMMNGDYGSTRYSKLAQINRDNVKNLRMVWAMALRGMQDIGQNGPENEVNPLIDNGFMYTSDGWGTVYKIDVRSGDHGEFAWIADPGVKHEGNLPRTRGIALWEDLVINNLPDGRVIAINRDSGEIVWDKQIAKVNEFGTKERFNSAPVTAEGKVLVANGAAGGGTRGWLAALDARTGNELWRWYAVPKPGEPGSETWKDKNNAWKTGGGGLWQTGSYDPVNKLTIWGTGNPVPEFDPQARPGDNLYTNSAVALDVNTGKLVWYYQYLPNNSWDYDEVGVHMLYDVNVNGEMRKVMGHFGRNGFFYTLDRANGSFIKGGQYVNDLNWTKGLDPKTGKPIEYDPRPRRAEIRAGSARVARRPDEADLPDLARRRRLSADRVQSGQADRLRRRRRGLLQWQRRRRGVQGAGRRAGQAQSFRSGPTAAISTTARSPHTTPSPARWWRRR